MTLTSLCPGPRGGRHLRSLPIPLHGRPAVPRGGAGREQPDDRALLPPPHRQVTAGHGSAPLPPGSGGNPWQFKCFKEPGGVEGGGRGLGGLMFC